MTRMVMVSRIVAAALTMIATSAIAKPHDVRVELKLETVSAIHVPTGCVSAVEYDDGTFIQAFITDPLCLPHGVTRRFIPASEVDFYSLDPQQAAIINQ